MTTHSPLRVLICQPVVPTYRVALFSALARHPGLAVRVCASRRQPGEAAPDSVAADLAFAHLDHPCLALLGGRLFWQGGLNLGSLGLGDVLVVSGNPRFVSNLPLMVRARAGGIGVVWWGQGFPRRRSALRMAVRRVTLALADAILLYTDQEADAYRQMGFPSRKVFATNNTVDSGAVRQAAALWPAERLHEFRQREGLLGKRVLLFCGRTTPKARVDLALWALARLSRVDDYLLVVIGGGEQLRSLKSTAEQLGVDSRVRWVGSLYEEAQLAPWFLSADLFVYPGAIGLSLLHSFAYGLPVVTNDDIEHHMPEIAALRDGYNGLLFCDNDIEDMAAKIRLVAEDAAYRERLSRGALETSQRYTMDAMVERFVAAIHAASAAAQARHSARHAESSYAPGP